jgi:UDP-GlcNAc3NAcA epimerase
MRIATVIGARPQFIKAVSVSRAIQVHNQTRSNVPFEEVFVHTGQHFDDNMSWIFLMRLSFPRPITIWESGGAARAKHRPDGGHNRKCDGSGETRLGFGL